MRKDNPIDKPITVSLFGTAASATLMVAFAIAYRIAGLFVPDTNAVMVTVHGIISLCGNILIFSTIATVASVIYSKLCDDRAIAERFAKPPKSSAVSSVLTRIAFVAIMICAVGFVIEIVGMVSNNHVFGGNWCAGSTPGVFARVRDNPVLRLQGQFYGRCFACLRGV